MIDSHNGSGVGIAPRSPLTQSAEQHTFRLPLRSKYGPGGRFRFGSESDQGGGNGKGNGDGKGEVMNELMMMKTLAQRLDRVERENRRLKRGGAVVLAVVAAVVLMGQATGDKVAKVLEAESFVVRDSKGALRAILGVWEDDEVRLLLPDRNGKSRAILAVKPDGSPYLGLYDKDGKRRIGMAVLQDGMLALGLAYTDDKSRAGLSVGPDGSPRLFLADKAGKVIWSAP